MKAFVAFTKKEFLESFCSFRAVVLLAAFALMGVICPLFIKYAVDARGSDVQGVFPLEFTAMESWQAFFGGIDMLGIMILAIVFCGIMANELSQGTLINLLTKGLRRSTVILAKFLTASILWTISYLLGITICSIIIMCYGPGDAINYVFFAFLAPWLLGELLIATLVLGGVLLKSYWGALVVLLVAIAILSTVLTAPETLKYNPMSITGGSLELLSGQKNPAYFAPVFITYAAITTTLVVAAIAKFNKKQL
ncbi:ABC transporter permease [Candidatus Saccharibacteria bacterium]|nr:ABC transporter permease [Candidatus Saccharibacteria bacterium]